MELDSHGYSGSVSQAHSDVLLMGYNIINHSFHSIVLTCFPSPGDHLVMGVLWVRDGRTLRGGA